MLKVLSCVAYDHDYSFVLVAAIVCIAGSIMTMRLFDRARRLDHSAKLAWVLLSGAAGGTAIWTTHFVAMLGFHPPVDYAYDPILTLLSFAFAIGFTAAGLHVAIQPGHGLRPEAGGGLIGIGIAVMHFTGMAGFKVAGHIEWDGMLVTASVVLGVLLGVLAANRGSRAVTTSGKMAGIGALVLAICCMHFTAMGAASFTPDPSVVMPPRTFSSELVAISVVAAMSIVTGLALYAIDARTRREMLDSFRHAAMHDPLTGMPNRAFLSSHLPPMLEEARSGGWKVAVIVIDLDRFKDINDVHGHKAGDAVLQSLTTRLSGVTGPGEFVARVGGDEFIAVKRGIVSPEHAHDFAQRLLACISIPVQQHDRTLSVGASLGISLCPGDAEEADELISVADLAMYRAKKQPGHKICFYDQSMDESRRKQSAIAMELRDAIERQEFELYYQPQVDVKRNEISGFEALIRWNHPRRGLVSPADFIPIAEETGLILPIGEWVLKTACAEAAGWKKSYKLAVNIASAQLTQTDLPRIVHETLLETGFAPARLELEITEASIIDDLQGTLRVVRQLKALGVTIAMDDYGTGYSSLSTLQLFPFDKIKIDRSFVEGVTTNKASSAIVKATILLASNLDIPVLAEGVERQEHFDFLRAEGCTEVQGYFFGRPQPLSEIADLVGRKEMGTGRRNATMPAKPQKQEIPARPTVPAVAAGEILPVSAVAQSR